MPLVPVHYKTDTVYLYSAPAIPIYNYKYTRAANNTSGKCADKVSQVPTYLSMVLCF